MKCHREKIKRKTKQMLIPFRNTSKLCIVSLPSRTWRKLTLPDIFPVWGMACSHCFGYTIFAGGGFYTDTTATVLKINSSSTFSYLKPMPQPKALFPLVPSLFAHTLTTVGGYRKSFLNEVTQMQLKRDIWINLPNLEQFQDGSAACLISGIYLYTFGGYPQGDPKSAIQLLDFHKLEVCWRTIYCTGASSFYNNSFQSAALLGVDSATVFGSYDSSEQSVTEVRVATSQTDLEVRKSDENCVPYDTLDYTCFMTYR